MDSGVRPPRATDDLAGRTLLVTGGNRGIGRGTALAAAAHAMNLVIAARGKEDGDAVVDEIRGTGGNAIFVPTDVTVAEDVRHAVEVAVATFGRLDCAFNNAGVSGPGQLADLDEETFDQTFAVNTRGLWLTMKYEIRQMLSQGGGSLVNNTSVHGFRTVFPGVSAYAASKYAAVSLTRSGALEYSSEGVRINGIAPGPIATDMYIASLQGAGAPAEWPRLTPTGRVGEPAEVAAVVLFLLSSAASHVNGQVLAIDGGFLAT